MTLYDVAGYLNCHYSTVYRLIQRGGFPVFRLGSDFRIRRRDLVKWIAQQQQVVAESEAPETPQLKGPQAPAKRKRELSAGVRKSETVSLGYPVVPVADSISG